MNTPPRPAKDAFLSLGIFAVVLALLSPFVSCGQTNANVVPSDYFSAAPWVEGNNMKIDGSVAFATRNPFEEPDLTRLPTQDPTVWFSWGPIVPQRESMVFRLSTSNGKITLFGPAGNRRAPGTDWPLTNVVYINAVNNSAPPIFLVGISAPFGSFSVEISSCPFPAELRGFEGLLAPGSVGTLLLTNSYQDPNPRLRLVGVDPTEATGVWSLDSSPLPTGRYGLQAEVMVLNPSARTVLPFYRQFEVRVAYTNDAPERALPQATLRGSLICNPDLCRPREHNSETFFGRWWEWTPTVSGELTFDLSSANRPEILEVFEASAEGNQRVFPAEPLEQLPDLVRLQVQAGRKLIVHLASTTPVNATKVAQVSFSSPVEPVARIGAITADGVQMVIEKLSGRAGVLYESRDFKTWDFVQTIAGEDPFIKTVPPRIAASRYFRVLVYD